MSTSTAARALAYAKTLARTLVRRRTPVQFNDLSSTSPVSRSFGTDRGQPIDRHYIEAFLRKHSADITGRVLEIGGAQYTRAFGRDVTASHVLHASTGNREATLVGDLAKLETLPAGEYDCLICTQTLNFIFDVDAAVAGLAHVLRPGGIALTTVAGISQISRYDMDRWGDYWRFTDASLRRLFEPVFGDGVEIQTHGNVTAALALLQGLAIEDLPDRRLLDDRDADYQVILTARAKKRP
jgi:SAM-dependent methyltransferase